MKRITLLMAAIVCLAISAMAEITDDQTLSPALWQQGIARCAQYTAFDKGFGKGDGVMRDKFPQGYTLSDLNSLYGGQGDKWKKIYDEFKSKENKGGTIKDLKETVTPQVWKLVDRDFSRFIKEHPELENADAVAAPDPGPEDESAENVTEEEDQKVENEGDTTVQAVKTDGKAGVSCTANLPLWLGILGSLLGLWALLTALSNRGKIKEMRRNFARELERTNANLQEFSTDAADQMKALSIRLTGKKVNFDEPIVDEAAEIVQEEPEIVEEEVEEPVAEVEEEIEEPVEEEPVEVVEEEPAEEPVEEEVEPAAEPVEEEEGEVVNLFMSRPDENDDFTRVSEEFEPGNSIYVLTTFDGQHGEFEIIDKPEVHRFALMMPAENLIRACSGNAIQIPNGTRIVTDRAGEAEFIDGKWHVVVKAIIHYEG